MSARAYAELRRFRPTVTTGVAAAALRVSTSSASRTLRTLEQIGLVAKVRRGLWSIDAAVGEARALAADITRPYPSYVSFESALFAHGVIDQVPRAITIASLGRPRVARTAVATFVIHRLPPELFGGFVAEGDVRLASIEKALFDFHYVTEASGRPKRRLPVIELPPRFSRRELERWLERISDARLRQRVGARLDRVITVETGRRGARRAQHLLSPRLVGPEDAERFRMDVTVLRRSKRLMPAASTR